MKTLQEIKDEYAKEIGHGTWDALAFCWAGFYRQMEPHENEISRRYAKEASIQSLKNASERDGCKFYGGSFGKSHEYVSKELIVSEINIPALT